MTGVEVLARDVTPGMTVDDGWQQHTAAEVAVHQPGYHYRIAYTDTAYMERWGGIAIRWTYPPGLRYQPGQEWNLYHPDCGLGELVTTNTTNTTNIQGVTS